MGVLPDRPQVERPQQRCNLGRERRELVREVLVKPFLDPAKDRYLPAITHQSIALQSQCSKTRITNNGVNAFADLEVEDETSIIVNPVNGQSRPRDKVIQRDLVARVPNECLDIGPERPLRGHLKQKLDSLPGR